LVIASQAIAHAAGPDDDGADVRGAYSELPFSEASNLALWAPWVRASLYLTDFLQHLKWTPGKRRINNELMPFTGVELSYEGNCFLTLHRPSAELFRKQLRHLRSYADQRADRAAEILTQTGFPSDYFASILGINGGTNRHCFELIGITQVMAAHVAMITKHHLACLRPDRRGATVMPMIPTPAHGSFPSAHAAEAFAVATVLSGLLDALASQSAERQPYPLTERLVALLYKQAERIAVNRTVAGVHYPIDTWAGAALGEVVGQIILANCRKGTVTWRGYNAEDSDFLLAHFRNPSSEKDGHTFTHGLERATQGFPISQSSLFGWLWNQTLNEFKP
jgi:hypothetical protein